MRTTNKGILDFSCLEAANKIQELMTVIQTKNGELLNLNSKFTEQLLAKEASDK